MLGRLHLLLDPDRTKAKERARNLAFLAALLTLVNGSPELRVSSLPSVLAAMLTLVNVRQPRAQGE